MKDRDGGRPWEKQENPHRRFWKQKVRTEWDLVFLFKKLLLRIPSLNRSRPHPDLIFTSSHVQFPLKLMAFYAYKILRIDL